MKAVYLKDKTGNNVVTVPYYRIGDLFLTTIATNPSSYLGGTWELFGPGRCLVCVDTSDSDFNTVKKTGGSKYIQEHKHNGNPGWGNLYYTKGGTGRWLPLYDSELYTIPTNGVSDVTTGNSGNLQPFITCYVWIRTA